MVGGPLSAQQPVAVGGNLGRVGKIQFHKPEVDGVLKSYVWRDV